MNTDVSDIRTQKSEILLNEKQKKKNTKNTDSSFLSVIHLLQQAGATAKVDGAPHPNRSQAVRGDSKSLTNGSIPEKKATQVNHLIEDGTAKGKNLQKNTSGPDPAKDTLNRKLVQKNNDFLEAHESSQTNKLNKNQSLSLNNDVLLTPMLADTRQHQVKTSLINDKRLNRNHQSHVGAAQRVVDQSLVAGRHENSSMIQRTSEKKDLMTTGSRSLRQDSQVIGHVENEQSQFVGQSRSASGYNLAFSEGNHEKALEKVNANDEKVQTIVTSRQSLRQDSQVIGHVKNEQSQIVRQSRSVSSHKTVFSEGSREQSLEKVNANDSLLQTDVLKKQDRLEHHRAVSGQMSKLELWTAFQAEKSPGKQSPVHEQVADHLSEWLGKSSIITKENGVQSFTVTLYPEHLGKLVISVSLGEQGLTAQLTAETQKAKNLLESGLGQLKQDCAGRGISLAQIDVNRQLYQVSDDDGAANQGQQQSSSQQDDHSQQDNQQHQKNRQTSLDAVQNDHSFLEWMMERRILNE